MKIQIRRSVRPELQAKGGRPLKYPFDRIRIGDAFDLVALTNKDDTTTLRRNLASLAYRYGQRNNGEMFEVEDRGSTVRCTRVA